MEKIELKFDDIISKIKQIEFPEIDLVVAIASGGIIPGALIANILKKDLKIIYLNFRDENHSPIYIEPRLIKDIDFDTIGKKILLVDDVTKTGKTFEKAKNVIESSEVKTFAINGNADYSLFNYEECLIFPWN